MGRGGFGGPHDVVDESDLILITGCMCCNVALYPEIPDCIGCSGKSELCCLVGRICLKADTSPLTCCDVYDSEVCIQIGLICCAIGCKCPTTLWKNQSQLFCFAISGACPPDHEIPCTCAFCFLALCPTCGICVRMRTKIHRGHKKGWGGGPVAPDAITDQPDAEETPLVQ
mmetsp:Transcript_28142/g.87073  ORF Transcript_28142/g.87073 Transcript_28142/m.87073 type:complete len:171 (+) Transcript_28142:305-817(+)